MVKNLEKNLRIDLGLVMSEWIWSSLFNSTVYLNILKNIMLVSVRSLNLLYQLFYSLNTKLAQIFNLNQLIDKVMSFFIFYMF